MEGGTPPPLLCWRREEGVSESGTLGGWSMGLSSPFRFSSPSLRHFCNSMAGGEGKPNNGPLVGKEEVCLEKGGRIALRVGDSKITWQNSRVSLSSGQNYNHGRNLSSSRDFCGHGRANKWATKPQKDLD